MRLRARAIIFGALAAALLGLATAASATWLSAASGGPATFATASVASPSSLTATSDCVRNVRNDVVLTWTASTSSFVDGYEVFRSINGNPAKSIATLSGIGTTGYTNAGLAFTKTFTYTVQSTVGTWRSSDSNSVTITTPNRRCQ